MCPYIACFKTPRLKTPRRKCSQMPKKATNQVLGISAAHKVERCNGIPNPERVMPWQVRMALLARRPVQACAGMRIVDSKCFVVVQVHKKTARGGRERDWISNASSRNGKNFRPLSCMLSRALSALFHTPPLTVTHTRAGFEMSHIQHAPRVRDVQGSGR